MIRLFAALMLSSMCAQSWAEQLSEPEVIVAPIYDADDPDSNNYYFVRLLKLALDKTVASHGAYRLEQPETYLVDSRLRASIFQGVVDLAWFTSSPEAETDFLAIKKPLLGAINEYHLLLIRREDQERFSQVKTIEELRNFTGGISEQWADAEVMRTNELPLVAVSRYPVLFKMLAAKRFDYFPRGLYQITSEARRHPELDLVIENSLMLHYPSFTYFFVAKGNSKLANRIQAGLELAQSDGSLDELFNSVPRFRWAQQLLESHSRRILRLKLPAQQRNQ